MCLKQVYEWLEYKHWFFSSVRFPWAPVYTLHKGHTWRMSKVHRNVGQGVTSRNLLRTLLQSVSLLMWLLSMCLHLFDGQFYFVDFKAHWQLLVLCPRKNIVVWFCSVRRKPDVHIKFVVNKYFATLFNLALVITCSLLVKTLHVNYSFCYFQT